MEKDEKKEKLYVKVMTPESILWEGKADAVSSENESGPFDILPEHANFLSLITNKPVIVHRGERDRKFDFDQSVIHVENDVVSVYANIASSLEAEDKQSPNNTQVKPV